MLVNVGQWQLFGTGLIKWDKSRSSVSGSHVLNSKDLVPRKGVVQNTKSHGRNLLRRKMRSDEVVQDPVSVQTTL
jgi:hypothetical protein